MTQNKSGYLLRPTGILRVVLIYEHVMAVHGKRFGIPKTPQLGKTLLRGSVLPRGYLTKSLSVGIHRLAVRPNRHSNCRRGQTQKDCRPYPPPLLSGVFFRCLFGWLFRSGLRSGRILLLRQARLRLGLLLLLFGFHSGRDLGFFLFRPPLRREVRRFPRFVPIRRSFGLRKNVFHSL